MRWKTRAGFDRTLGPDGVTEFLRAIREAQQALRAQEETAGRLRRLQEELELWEDQARDLLVELGLESGLVEGSGDVLPRRIRELARLCVEDQATRDRLGRLEEELRALEAKLRAAREGARDRRRSRQQFGKTSERFQQDNDVVLVRCATSPGHLTGHAQAVFGRGLADLECRPEPVRAGYLRRERASTPEDGSAREDLTRGSPTEIREDQALPLRERGPEVPLAEISRGRFAAHESLRDCLIGHGGVRCR